ncbi:TetR/AcrR family transcriptional regulator [Brevibacillus daliensis]|uniref:TetR/AcrR family transcriptional regulator n=1 Tax=Brevibacillus daliensis TaxID=2892995 RepID=UPI001E5C5C84|nr:TetR family transcriptional regulator C-terminal domain-containing protein [Brevibacillus daliensis]
MARRTAEEAEQTKQAIAEAAKQLFIQHGYQATSMDQIRLASATSKGSIYYHFKNKEKLFLYLLELNVMEWVTKCKEQFKTAATATEKLYIYGRISASDFNNPLLHASIEFSGTRGADPEVTAKVVELSKVSIPLLKEVVLEGIANQEFKPEDEDKITLMLHIIFSGLGVLLFEDYTTEEIEKLHDKAIDLFLNGIRLT